MTTKDLNRTVDWGGERIAQEPNNILLFPPTAEEMKSFESMPISEIDALLIEMGIDPDVKLPEKIYKRIYPSEEQKTSPSNKNNFPRIDENSGAPSSNIHYRSRQQGKSLTWLSIAAALIAVFVYVPIMVSTSIQSTYTAGSNKNENSAEPEEQFAIAIQPPSPLISPKTSNPRRPEKDKHKSGTPNSDKDQIEKNKEIGKKFFTDFDYFDSNKVFGNPYAMGKKELYVSDL